MSSGAPLTISQALAVALDQHRDAPALEVERHLVDLAPAGRRRARVREDGLVQRALDAALEVAVEVGAGASTRALSAPATSTCAPSAMRASVSVPVLSVHSTSIAPRSWMAASRLTITLRLAMRIAPRDSVTVMTIGSSSGVSPTASATANRKRFQHRPVEQRRSPAARTAPAGPSGAGSAGRSGGCRARRRSPAASRPGWSASWPSAVCGPVRQTSTVALPLTTAVPAEDGVRARSAGRRARAAHLGAAFRPGRARRSAAPG